MPPSALTTVSSLLSSPGPPKSSPSQEARAVNPGFCLPRLRSSWYPETRGQWCRQPGRAWPWAIGPGSAPRWPPAQGTCHLRICPSYKPRPHLTPPAQVPPSSPDSLLLSGKDRSSVPRRVSAPRPPGRLLLSGKDRSSAPSRVSAPHSPDSLLLSGENMSSGARRVSAPRSHARLRAVATDHAE